MAYMNRETRMLRVEILAMVERADPETAHLLLGIAWDGPRWHEPSGRVVLRLTARTADEAQRIMASSEAMAALHGRMQAACFGAPWAVTWHVVRPIGTTAGEDAPAAPPDVADEGALALMRVAADAWERGQ